MIVGNIQKMERLIVRTEKKAKPILFQRNEDPFFGRY